MAGFAGATKVNTISLCSVSKVRKNVCWTGRHDTSTCSTGRACLRREGKHHGHANVLDTCRTLRLARRPEAFHEVRQIGARQFYDRVNSNLVLRFSRELSGFTGAFFGFAKKRVEPNDNKVRERDCSQDSRRACARTCENVQARLWILF